MGQITINLPDEALAMVKLHAEELGYPHAGDMAFEVLRNHIVARHDDKYERQNHLGEHNETFGASERERADQERRSRAQLVADAKRKSDEEAMQKAAQEREKNEADERGRQQAEEDEAAIQRQVAIVLEVARRTALATGKAGGA
jgi:hypothetical protein